MRRISQSLVRMMIIGIIMINGLASPSLWAAVWPYGYTLMRHQDKACIGYCDRKNINCTKREHQGYYLWCQKHCMSASQPNFGEYRAALDQCDHGPLHKTYRGHIVGKSSKRKLYHVIIVNVRSPSTSMIGKQVDLPFSLTQGLHLQKGDLIEFDRLSSRQVTIANVGEPEQIQDVPIKKF